MLLWLQLLVETIKRGVPAHVSTGWGGGLGLGCWSAMAAVAEGNLSGGRGSCSLEVWVLPKGKIQRIMAASIDCRA